MKLFRMIKMNQMLLTLILFFASAISFAHGEDKPGPHGGVIRMPGAFHTEVILLGKNKVKVFLLDINLKNPTVLDSSVETSFTGAHKKVKALCEKKADAFLCTFDKGIDLSSEGKLLIQAHREKLPEATAEYKTPFKK